VQKYFQQNAIDINLNTAALNFSTNVNSDSGKLITKAEIDYLLNKSIFNFIFRLKCNQTQQFINIDQALEHDFIKSLSPTNQQIPTDSINTPADY
jgi:hypothetical protein